MVFGINSTRNAVRKGNSTRLRLVLFYALPDYIARTINPKYHRKLSYYIYRFNGVSPLLGVHVYTRLIVFQVGCGQTSERVKVNWNWLGPIDKCYCWQ